MAEATARAAASLPRSITGMGRHRGVLVVALAAIVGLVGGLVVALMSGSAQLLHEVMFKLEPGARLSAQTRLVDPVLALLPAGGGILMGVTIFIARRFRNRPPVDPIEANAMHGGRMSFRDSVLVAVQTIISTGFGASVGLEAGYTQMTSALSSWLATRLQLRRNEVRTLVGCGAAAAIAAAFSAPLTGAFYGFELIIGAYSPSLIAPVMLSALLATAVMSRLGAVQLSVDVGHIPKPDLIHILPLLGLGVVGAGVAVAIMRLTELGEFGFRLGRVPPLVRPMIGGLAVGGLALVSPHILSSGHGAIGLAILEPAVLPVVAGLFVLKILASIISLGAGFRGGLFFASLYIGALMGKLFAAILLLFGFNVDPVLASLVGMAALAVGIIGGPLTMTFLVLETTGDLAISVAVLFASVISTFIVRETFGYSFSTWRLHLRGESIRSAHDVGRLRNLKVSAMMRSDPRTIEETATLAEFCQKFALGSTERAIAIDPRGRYVGIVLVAEAHQAFSESDTETPQPITPLLRHQDRFLLPSMNARDAAILFEKSNAEELAVVDSPDRRRVVGLLTEAYLLRRYAEELDKGWRDLTGESE